jgi:drug/metabolite transporter (DMT)-like permease
MQARWAPDAPFERQVNSRKYLVLAGVAVFAATGDAMLSAGMKQTGSISVRHLPSLIAALVNPWVAIGIVLLVGFFATYMNALSWADLTYVLPASSLGYVLLALIAKFALHEHISVSRWLGIALISVGVGFVAAGPAATTREESGPVPDRLRGGADNVSEPGGRAASGGVE